MGHEDTVFIDGEKLFLCFFVRESELLASGVGSVVSLLMFKRFVQADFCSSGFAIRLVDSVSGMHGVWMCEGEFWEDFR